MPLNPTDTGDSHRWNYSDPNSPGYSTSIIGTVANFQEVQAMKFAPPGQPKLPDFWPDGNPKMNIRVILIGPSGGFRTLTFTPAGKAAKQGEKKSLHIDLFNLAGGQNIMDLVGKTIEISTQEPPAGFGYGQGNPRPWNARLVEDQGPFVLKEPLDPIYLAPRVMANQAVSGGVMQPPMQQPPMQQAPQNMQPQQASDPQPQPEDDIPF